MFQTEWKHKEMAVLTLGGGIITFISILVAMALLLFRFKEAFSF